MNLEEFREIKHLRTENGCKCGQEFSEYWYHIKGERVCEDCYFDAFGEGVEEHPICSR